MATAVGSRAHASGTSGCLATTASPASNLKWLASAASRAWSPALQADPVLIRQFHPSPRPRGWEGFLVHILEVLDDDLGVEFGRHHCNVRSYFAH
jgi:hypothetical protein